MDYTAQLTGKCPSELDLGNITQTEVRGGTGKVTNLNMIFISDDISVGSQRVKFMNVNDIIPVMYKPGADQSIPDSFYYLQNGSDISATYSLKPKINEAHIPYIHAGLVDHGKLPYQVFNTISNTDIDDSQKVVSALDAESLVNNVGRVLAIDSQEMIYLYGFHVDENSNVEINALSGFRFKEDSSSDPMDNWRQSYRSNL